MEVGPDFGSVHSNADPFDEQNQLQLFTCPTSPEQGPFNTRNTNVRSSVVPPSLGASPGREEQREPGNRVAVPVGKQAMAGRL